MVDLTPAQLEIANSPLDSKRFLSGPASCGKTTTGVERLRVLLQNRVPGDSILVLTPQRTLQEPYFDLLHSPECGAGGEVTPATVGGLARRMVDLFWPLVGVLSVWLMYVLVKRVFGPTAGVISALVLAVTPISVAANRNNTMDSLLVLTSLPKAYSAGGLGCQHCN